MTSQSKVFGSLPAMHIFSDSASDVGVSMGFLGALPISSSPFCLLTPNQLFSISLVSFRLHPPPRFPPISLQTFDVTVSLEDDVKEVIKYLRETEEVYSDAGEGFLTSQLVVWIGRPARSLANNRVKRNWVITTSNNNNNNKTPTKAKPSSFKKKLGGISWNTMSFWSFFSQVAGKPQTARWVGSPPLPGVHDCIVGPVDGCSNRLIVPWVHVGVCEKTRDTPHGLWVGPWIVHYRHIYIYIQMDILFMRYPHWKN